MKIKVPQKMFYVPINGAVKDCIKEYNITQDLNDYYIVEDLETNSTIVFEKSKDMKLFKTRKEALFFLYQRNLKDIENNVWIIEDSKRNIKRVTNYQSEILTEIGETNE